MSKCEKSLLRRTAAILFCMILTVTTVFAADTAKKEKKDAPLTKDGQITSISLDKKSGNTTVVLMLGKLNMPEPPKGKPGENQPPAADNAKQDVKEAPVEGKAPAEKGNAPDGKKPEIIKLNGKTIDIVLTSKTKIRYGMPNNNNMPGMNNGQMPPPQDKSNAKNSEKKDDKKDMKNDSGKNQKMPPEQSVKITDLKIDDVLEIIYEKDGKTVDSILVIRPFLQAGLDGRVRPMMGMQMGRHNDMHQGMCPPDFACGERMGMGCPVYFMMPPPCPPQMMMPPPPPEFDDAAEETDTSSDVDETKLESIKYYKSNIVIG